MFISRNKFFSALKELNLAASENRAAHLPVSEQEFEYMRESIQSSVFVGVFIENVLGEWWTRWKNQLRFNNTENIYTGGVMFFHESDETDRVVLGSLTGNHLVAVPKNALSDKTEEEHDYCFPHLMLVNISNKSIQFSPMINSYLAEINKSLEKEHAL